MKKREKRLVPKMVDSMDITELKISVDDMIAKLQGIKEEYKDVLRCYIEGGLSEKYGYTEGNLYIMIDREETDKEQESRLKREKAQEVVEEKTRHSQYLSLKEEFGEKE